MSELEYSNLKNLSKEELIKRVDELEKKTSMQENFLINISHDLRSPISVILSILQCIDSLGYSVDNDYKRVEHRRLIKRNSLKMIKLIDNLIDATKLDGNYYNFNKKNIDVINIIEGTISSIAKYARQKDIEIIFDTNVDECIMSMEAEALDRIVMNLTSNAIKFSPEGSKILINAMVNDNKLELSIKDNGAGIAKEEQEKIFSRFVQATKQKESASCGSGIGLDLVSNLTAALGGTIKLVSEEGSGSEFILVFPITINDNEGICKELIKKDNVEMLEIEFSDIYL